MQLDFSLCLPNPMPWLLLGRQCCQYVQNVRCSKYFTYLSLEHLALSWLEFQLCYLLPGLPRAFRMLFKFGAITIVSSLQLEQPLYQSLNRSLLLVGPKNHFHFFCICLSSGTNRYLQVSYRKLKTPLPDSGPRHPSIQTVA